MVLHTITFPNAMFLVKIKSTCYVTLIVKQTTLIEIEIYHKKLLSNIERAEN